MATESNARRKFRTIAVAGLSAAMLLMAGQAWAATTLYAWDTTNEDLFTLDTAGPTLNFVGGGNSGIIAEIEFGGGVIYAADTGDNTNLHVVDPGTGLYTSTITMIFPPEGNVVTSMEFVGSTLYAGLTTEGGGTTYLSTIDTGSGVVTVIGSTGFGSPLGGLAYDGSTMYAISAGGSSSELFTVDLGFGAATSVGLVTIGGGDFGGTTALEFGGDGVLYALPNINSAISGHLLSIDPATGDATDLGDTGAPFLVALTSAEAAPVPTISGWGLFAMGLILLAVLTMVVTRFRRAATV